MPCMITGASGASNLEFPTAMNAVLGTRMKLVRGYKGSDEVALAIDLVAEVDMRIELKNGEPSAPLKRLKHRDRN